MKQYLKFWTILPLVIAIDSQLPTDCGRRLSSINRPMSRIIGGNDAKLGDYPWQVSIVFEIMNKSMHVCGGSLINSQWILTAAHCMDSGLKMEYYSVLIGLIDLDLRYSSTFKKFYINKTIIHRDWDLNKTLNDIALIKLSEKVNVKIQNKSVEPICMTKNDINLTKEVTKCYVTGWGAVWAHFNETNFEVGPTSKILKQVMIPIFDIEKCADVHYSRSREDQVNTTTEICAGGSLEGGSGICVGDSGGPLQCQLSDNKWYQIGIVSWTFRCAAPGVPDVFTRVSHYYDWIQFTIQNN